MKWQRGFWLLLMVVTAWRLVYLLITPLDLVPDEAYYWDWGRHFSWGYYSKPPLIAWINGLSSALLGATPFSVRLPAVLCGSVTLIALFGLAKRMFDARTAFWAAALAVIAPGSAIINLIMTIDAPLVCCWMLALYTLWRALEENGRASWLVLTILLCGVGLLAKQMMFFFPIITLLFLAASAKERHHLRRPWPYFLLILPLFFLIPDLWWNSQHGWITFQHTAHHFEGNHTFWRFLTTLPDFVGGQLLLIAPLTWLIFIVLALGMARQFKSLAGRLKFLLLFSALPLAIFALMSLRQRINANWPAVFYSTSFVLTAAWATGQPVIKKRLSTWRRLFPWAIYSAVFLSILTYSLTIYIGHTSLGGGSKDPFHRLKGWHELGTEISQLQKNAGTEGTFLLAVTRQTASELAFYVKAQPQVFLWNDRRGIVTSQYDLWPGPVDKIGRDALLVVEKGHNLNTELRRSFREVNLLKELRIPMGEAASRDYVVYRGHNLLKWPR
jgi:4-amino-4-deoxy-L-arabinose transferase-like glycosyltransferase